MAYTRRSPFVRVRPGLLGLGLVLVLIMAGVLASAWCWWLIPRLRGDYRTTPEFRKMKEAEVFISTRAGEEIRLTVRVADEQDEQLAGFQHIGRKVLARSLILFVFPQEIRGKFHMRNVLAPLDIAFIREDGEIFSIIRMEPGLELYGPEPDEPFKYALEAPADLFSERGIEVGSSLRFLPSPSPSPSP